MPVRFEQFATDDGAFGSKAMDLFPTVSACKTAQALGFSLGAQADLRRAVLARRTPAGGLGAQPGQPADAWSTVYGVESLSMLGFSVPPSMTSYLLSLDRDGGFAMALGQEPETWSTAFVVTGLALCGIPLPDVHATLEWLISTMVPTGGFTWSPAWVSRRRPDVRATAFVIKALKAAGLLPTFSRIADLGPTVQYLKSQQAPGGGFQLDDRHPPCLWGVGEAVSALALLGHAPVDSDGCVRFVRSLRRNDGGYRRGLEYLDHSDLWATTHGTLSRLALGDGISDGEKNAVAAFVASCGTAEGGYTYRPPASASDVLATSAAAIAAAPAADGLLHFLSSCRMPGEGGVAFMPGRGSESRSAMWTMTALARRHFLGDERALGRWAQDAQSPDGGFGPWEGRASNAVSTNAVLTALTTAGHDLAGTIDLTAVTSWITSAWTSLLHDDQDGDLVDLSSLLCAADAIGLRLEVQRVRDVLVSHRRSGAWRRNLRTLPDLLATYTALTAHQVLGDLDAVLPEAASWVTRLPTDEAGTAWSHLSRGGGGPLPTALATLVLASADSGDPLPNLTL